MQLEVVRVRRVVLCQGKEASVSIVSTFDTTGTRLTSTPGRWRARPKLSASVSSLNDDESVSRRAAAATAATSVSMILEVGVVGVEVLLPADARVARGSGGRGWCCTTAGILSASRMGVLSGNNETSSAEAHSSVSALKARARSRLTILSRLRLDGLVVPT